MQKKFHKFQRIGLFALGVVFISGCATPIEMPRSKEVVSLDLPEPKLSSCKKREVPIEYRNDGEIVRLSLERSLALIRRENLQMLLQRESVTQALEEAYEKRAELFPQITAEVSQSRSQDAFFLTRFGARGASITNRFDGKLVANLDFLNSDNLADYWLSRFGYEISKLNYEKLVQDILVEAARSFFDYQRSLKKMLVIEASVARDESLLEMAEARAEAGVATLLDVTRARVTLNQAKQQKLQQETVITEAALRLKSMLNLPARKEVVLENFEKGLSYDGRFKGQFGQELLSARPEYREALKTLDQNILVRKAASWEQLPSVSLNGEYGIANEEISRSNNLRQWRMGITVSMPIFEGFRTKARVGRAASLVRAQRKRLQDLENKIEREHLNALQDMQSRLDQLPVAESTADLSRMELELSIERFKEGIADNQEVIDAQTGLAQAEDEVVEAAYRYQIARLAFARSLGNVEKVLDEF